MKIGIFGIPGHNLGDECIAVVSYRELKNSMGDEVNIVMCVLKKNTLSRYGITEYVLDRKTLSGNIDLIKYIKSLDMVIIGGGTLIQDKLGAGYIRGVLGFTNHITFIASLYKIPIYTLPIGIDYLHSSKNKFIASRVLKRLKFINLRDKISYKIASQIDSSTSNKSLVGADPAFLMYNDSGVSKLDNNNYIVISLVRENLDTNKFLPAVNLFIKKMINEGISVILLAMDDRVEEELILYENIVNEIKSEQISIFDIKSDIFEIYDLLKNAKFLLAMRLHAMILAVGNTKMVGISRTTKTETFLSEFQIPTISLNNLITYEDIYLKYLEAVKYISFDVYKKTIKEKIALVREAFDKIQEEVNSDK